MDDLVMPLSDECRVALFSRITDAARILGATATTFGLEVQYGPGKTEVDIVLSGAGEQQSMTTISQCEAGEGQDRKPVLPIGHGQFLRVARNYKNLGATAAASLRFGPEVSDRVSTSRAAESVLASKI